VNDLVKFLRARLDEDEAKAEKAGGNWWFDQPAGLPDTYSLDFGRFRAPSVGFTDNDVIRPAEAEHIARYDPSHVLHEIACKRFILADHTSMHTVVDGFCVEEGGRCTHAGEAMCSWHDREDCPTVRALALMYAGHPEYQDEWKP
jgi:Family of unknown function (DUF6221)